MLFYVDWEVKYFYKNQKSIKLKRRFLNMSKDIKKLIEEAGQLIDQLLDEAKQNEIPEVPDNEKTAGKDVKKEIEGKSNGDSKAVVSKGDPMEENVDNYMPEIPDESKTAGKDIKKAVATAINPKLGKIPSIQQPKIDNTLPDGITPDPVKSSAKKMIKDIAEALKKK